MTNSPSLSRPRLPSGFKTNSNGSRVFSSQSVERFRWRYIQVSPSSDNRRMNPVSHPQSIECDVTSASSEEEASVGHSQSHDHIPTVVSRPDSNGVSLTISEFLGYIFSKMKPPKHQQLLLMVHQTRNTKAVSQNKTILENTSKRNSNGQVTISGIFGA